MVLRCGLNFRHSVYNPHRLCRKSRSLLGCANVSASIVLLKRLIVSKTFHDTCLMTKPTKWFVCPAKTQISLGIRCPHEESFVPYLPTECTAKTLIRLSRCPGWSESSLSAQSFSWFCHEAAHFFLQKLTIREVLCSAFKLLSSCSFTSVAVTLCIIASAKSWAEQNIPFLVEY